MSLDPPRQEANNGQVLESRALVMRLPCVGPALLPCADPLRFSMISSQENTLC
jgi:hypothetical protein